MTFHAVQYTYDSLNRLITAQAGSSWGETYTFDGFGNLTQKTATGTAPPLSVGIDPTTNRIVSSSYDANGNMLTASGVSLTYSENRVIQTGASPGITYGYDAQNERIFSWSGGVDGCSRITGYQIFMYSPSGQRVGTYQITSTCGNFSSALTTSDTYFGSRRIAAMDRLASAGKYYPYGEDKGTAQNDTWNFATYWRDSATGLDYAMNRYYSNSLGRFTSPDQFRGRVATPQSLNRYGYAAGDPVNGVDPIGRFDCSPEEPDCRDPCDEDPELCDPGPGPAPDPPPSFSNTSPCWTSTNLVIQTLTDIGRNIIEIFEARDKHVSFKEIAGLEGLFATDIGVETAITSATALWESPGPYYVGGHFNLDLATKDLINVLGSVDFKEFDKIFGGTHDGTRQDSGTFGNKSQGPYTLHSKRYHHGNDTFAFHFDKYNPGDVVGFVKHLFGDVIGGHNGTPCLDPAWVTP